MFIYFMLITALAVVNGNISTKSLTPVILDTSGKRMLDTTDTVNTLIQDLEFAIELGPLNIECTGFKIGALNFDASGVTIVEGNERMLVSINVDDFEASCRAAAIRFTSDGSQVNFKLEFFSSDIGRVIPVKGQVPQDFSCVDEFLDLQFEEFLAGALEDQIPPLACDLLEPLFLQIGEILSNNILIDIGGVRPPVAPDVTGIVPVVEADLASTIPEGFQYHDEEQFNALISQWIDDLLDTTLIELLREQVGKIVEAIKADDALALAFALESLVLELVGISVPIPLFIAEGILSINFGEGGIGDIISQIFENLDLSLGSIISFILNLLGIDFGTPSPDAFTTMLQVNPLAKIFLDQSGLTELTRELLANLQRSHNDLNVAQVTTVLTALKNSKDNKLTRFLAQFPDNEKLSIALSHFTDIPFVELLHIFTAFSEEEIHSIVGYDDPRSVKEFIFDYFKLVFPQNTFNAYEAIQFLAKESQLKEAIDLVELIDVFDDSLGINFTLGDFGTIVITFEDIGFDFDLSLDGELSGFSFESTLIFPKILINKLGLTLSLGLDIIVGETTISDTLTISGGIDGFTQEALTIIFSYDALFDYSFKNAEDLPSALKVIGDLAGCVLANTGIALSQSTSLDINANLNSIDAFDGFAENLINTILRLYLPIIPTLIEKILADFSAEGFLTITNFEQGCTRQGFVENEFVDDATELFSQINDNAFVIIAISGMVLMSLFAVFHILRKEPEEQPDTEAREREQVQTL